MTTLCDFLERDLGYDVEPALRRLELTCSEGSDAEFLPAATALLRRWTRDPHVLTSAKALDEGAIGDPALNRAGLHAARVVLARCAARRYLAEPRLLTDGLLTFPDLLPPDVAATAVGLVDRVTLVHEAKCDANRPGPGFDRALSLIRTTVLGLFRPRTKRLWGTFDRTAFVQRLQRFEADPQRAAHSDTFFPAIKWWWFPRAVTALGGPFLYARGSARLPHELLRWRHDVAVRAAEGRAEAVGTREGSFRFAPADLAALNYELAPVAVPANTLVVANVFGVHARGAFLPGVQRASLHGSIRVPYPFDPYQDY